jgi:hypothetical protein
MVVKRVIPTLEGFEILVPSALREDTVEEKRHHSTHLAH